MHLESIGKPQDISYSYQSVELEEAHSYQSVELEEAHDAAWPESEKFFFLKEGSAPTFALIDACDSFCSSIKKLILTKNCIMDQEWLIQESDIYKKHEVALH
jgi:hypothetical protein